MWAFPVFFFDEYILPFTHKKKHFEKVPFYYQILIQKTIYMRINAVMTLEYLLVLASVLIRDDYSAKMEIK